VVIARRERAEMTRLYFIIQPNGEKKLATMRCHGNTAEHTIDSALRSHFPEARIILLR